MALHLIKLCVGCDSVADLRTWRAERAARGERAVCNTRQTPKRGAEIEGVGSLYWVVRGVILCREPIVTIDTFGEGPTSRCEIVLGGEPVLVEPHPRRAFQGWRYLTDADAPADLTASNDTGLPPELSVRLREIGAW